MLSSRDEIAARLVDTESTIIGLSDPLGLSGIHFPFLGCSASNCASTFGNGLHSPNDMKMKFNPAIAIIALVLTGCATPDIVRMDGDTYFIQKRSAQVGFGPPEAAKAEIYEAANNFCEARGMALETVNFTMVNSGFGRPGSVALQFRCVPRTAPQSDTAVQSSTSTSDHEMRLRSLNELKQRGLITEEEFQKKRSEIIHSL